MCVCVCVCVCVCARVRAHTCGGYVPARTHVFVCVQVVGHGGDNLGRCQLMTIYRSLWSSEENFCFCYTTDNPLQ